MVLLIKSITTQFINSLWLLHLWNAGVPLPPHTRSKNTACCVISLWLSWLLRCFDSPRRHNLILPPHQQLLAEDEFWPKAKGWETTVSLETLEAAIDPKGGKADGISLTWGKLHHVTQADQCLPPPPLSLFFLPWGTFADSRLLLSLASGQEKEKDKNKIKIRNLLTDVWETLQLPQCFDLEEWRTASWDFSCRVFPSATSQAMYEIKKSCDVEDPQMPHLLRLA